MDTAAFSPDADQSSTKKVRVGTAPPNPAAGTSPFKEFLDTASAETENTVPRVELGHDASDPSSLPRLDDDLPSAFATPASEAGEFGVVAADDTEAPAAMSSENSGPQSPGVTVQWVKHGGFNVGQECDVELVVKNTSQTVVRSVMAEAVIPANVEFVERDQQPSKTPKCRHGRLVNCSLANRGP